MSYDNSVDKDRLDFTQFNGNFPIRCPICNEIVKVIRHSKVYRNFHACWCHIKRDHNDIPKLKLNQVIHIFNILFQAIKGQIIPEWVYSKTIISETPTATSSSILIDGHAPRIDQWGKIIEIATFLRAASEYYPDFHSMEIIKIIRQAAGVRDSRTIQRYFDCVTNYSKKDYNKGEYNVREFCKKVIGV